MKRTQANMMADFINEGPHNRFEDTSIIAEVIGDEQGYEVKIYPSVMNTKPSEFYHAEVLTDMARGFRVHTYLSIEDGQIIGHLL